MKRLFSALSILFFAGWMIFLTAGCSRAPQQVRIGIDPNWYPLDFQDKQFYINGFIDELLLEISKHSNIEFHRIGANWDTLLEGLKQQRYDAILSSLPPYPFNQAKFEFSTNFLDIGPVFVTPAASAFTELKQMTNSVVGVLSGDQESLVIQKYSDVVMRTYDSVPEIFDVLINNEVEGIVIDRLTAVGFVRGIYAGKLKINGSPLTDAGLHVVALKGDSARAVNTFNKSLRYLAKKKKLQKLLRKWQLDV